MTVLPVKVSIEEKLGRLLPQNTKQRDVDRNSMLRSGLSLLPAFLLGATFGLGKIVRDCSLTCNVGYQWAPLAILAVSLGALPASSAHVRLQERD